jgi:uncharacterized membrane protein YkoI
MKNTIKKLFGTPLKATLSITSLITILAILGSGTVFAAGTQKDKNTASPATISLEDAKKIALNDANLTEDSVTFTSAKLDTEDGNSVYEIEFYAENVEFEYEIYANNGTIYSKSKEITVANKQEASTETAKQPTKTEAKDNTTEVKEKDTNADNNTKVNKTTTKSESKKQKATANMITLDTAKKKALADADVTAASVTFTEAKLDYDDGVAVYEIEFYTSSREYDYEINANTGAVHDKSVEVREKKENEQPKSNDNNTGSSGDYIGVDKAKSIAVNHAGLSISDVTFSKTKLDHDDGNTVYDIEFFKDGIEYEYEVDASSGKILEYDIEQDD